jgi:hypothetical protein
MMQPRHGFFLSIAVLAGAALLVVSFAAPRLAAAGWLIAFILLSSIPLGGLAWLMISRLTGGYWGKGLGPTFECVAATIPLLVILFIPILVALPLLYPWVGGSAAVKADVAILYLNVPLFILRASIAWTGWSVFVLLLARRGGRAGLLYAAVGLIFHALMVSLVSVDWILSIEPAFISTSFGATVAITQMLAGLAFAALFAPDLDDRVVRDLGALMLTATLGVTYLNFMAVLVIWYGNLPTRVSWFVERAHEPWKSLAVATFVLGSVIPILFLLLARVRSSRRGLRYVAASSFAGIGLYDAWLLAPAYGPWALGTAVVATVAIACASIVIVRVGWPAALFDRAGTVP